MAQSWTGKKAGIIFAGQPGIFSRLNNIGWVFPFLLPSDFCCHCLTGEMFHRSFFTLCVYEHTYLWHKVFCVNKFNKFWGRRASFLPVSNRRGCSEPFGNTLGLPHRCTALPMGCSHSGKLRTPQATGPNAMHTFPCAVSFLLPLWWSI